MTRIAYARVLFSGPGLSRGALTQSLRQRAEALLGEAHLHDSEQDPEAFWQAVADAPRPLLVVDLEPRADAMHRDWLRQRIAERGNGEAVFVVCSALEDAWLDGLAALLEQTGRHLPCLDVPALPEQHPWSQIPPHSQRLLLCNGPRCTRKGALGLWKTLRQRLKAAGRLECPGGVHITRSQCQFPCDLGPTASLYPQGEWYGVSDEAAVIRLVDERLVAGRAVPELRIDQPDDSAQTH
ncbi:(2Fe-2S) ferredoxin domain-containing protein [Ectopseudomonas khazarica]|uniref:(2Fe-2S) ferredoxin domain-containing protein n=1 Tax=Ectopseudomonas khazarica TaxID=2502979 RepID=UPI002FDF74B5